MTTQYLTDERGAKVAVVIPIADYDALMQDVADLACVAERCSQISREKAIDKVSHPALATRSWKASRGSCLAAEKQKEGFDTHCCGTCWY